MRRFLGATLAASLLLVLTWVVATMRPSWGDVAWTIAVLILFGAATVSLVREAGALGRREPSELDRLLRGAERARARPPDLERLEHILGWRSYSPQDFSYRVRALFEELIRYRLAAGRGVDVTSRPDVVRELLPPELRELVFPDLPHDSDGPNITTRDMARLVELIEGL
jgi:hypothetical protein